MRNSRTIWMSVFRQGHELTGLGLVVIREVQTLEIREQLLTEIGLDPEIADQNRP